MSDAFDALRSTLVRHGARPALRGEGEEISYARLLEAIAERRGVLEAVGARRVALALDNGPQWALWDLALLAGGQVCVPLPGFFSPTQQMHVLDSAGIDTLIVDPAAASATPFAGFVPVAPGILQRTPPQLPALPAGVEQAFYRVAQESLENIRRHAAARSASLSLRYQDNMLQLAIQDDGVGVKDATSASYGHFGIKGMQERAAAIGADLSIKSVAGKGTQIRMIWEGTHDQRADM